MAKPKYSDPEHIRRRDYMRAYYRKNSEQWTANLRERYARGELTIHRPTKAVARVKDLDYRQRRRVQMQMLLGGRCERCGFNDSRALQIDHINGGGCHDRKIHRRSVAPMQEIFANPDKYQLLCANCNWIKRWERNEHGHTNKQRLVAA